ncbi:MAG: isoprenylcysteine carboxylmethyltransferase family protein [Desulfobacterales bacterium]|jgi:protein-S-isoprenylcysteine O-methyltransferase Ste14
MENIKEINKKASRSAIWFAYIVIFFEMIYMSTPFAVFFYSVYRPPLQFLNESSATFWLVQNIFPHFAQTNSVFINSLLYASWPLMGTGLAIFLISFIQLYWAKFRKKGAVEGGLYRFIRHPQYIGWSIFGLGIAIFWSRMIVILMYVSMLFVYYLLARSEERDCLEKYGERYRSYYRKTGRFFPKLNPNKRYLSRRTLPEKGVKRTGTLIIVYLLTIFGTIGLGLFLRSYSLSNISSVSRDNAAVISTFPMDEGQINAIVAIAMQDKIVKRKLAPKIDFARTAQLIYIIPLEWKIPELAMESAQAGQRDHGFNPTNHMNPTDFDRNLYKVLFSKAGVDKNVAGKDIISKARYQKPLLLVKLNLQTNRVIGVETPPDQGKYGDLPVPIF